MTFAETYIATALGITSQPWKDTGLANDPATAPSDDMEETTNRITALILIRVCAWIMPRGMFTDLSTTTMCRSMLVNDSLWPEELTEEVVQEIKDYVKTILQGYNPTPYHNFRHAYHVTISTNKLVDMIVHQYPNENLANTFGFRDDPLMQFCILFSALIHDVDHRGIPNRQLSLDDEELAMRYNDQSIAENHSLFIAFCELRKPKYEKFRCLVFPHDEDYRRFRSSCINLVLSTDIASPERTQLGKSKWKEAFGAPYESVERKLVKEAQKRNSIGNPAQLLDTVNVEKTELDDESTSVTSRSSEDDLNDLKRGGKCNMKKLIEKDSTERLSGKVLKYHRRLSKSLTAPPTPRRSRLGFRRSMDLSGQYIEAYNEEKRVSASNAETTETKIVLPPPEKIDDVRETVIMETIIKAADVAHNLQGFRQMAKWSSCLYLELRKAHIQNKGDDPMKGWYDNQTGFLDYYVLPLARKLDDTGAYGETRGAIFGSIVEQNRDRWVKEGEHVTLQTVKHGEDEFPLGY